MVPGSVSMLATASATSSISASSQPEALKGPLAKFDGIGHAIPSERAELLIDGSFEFVRLSATGACCCSDRR